MDYYIPASDEHIAREKDKARDLRGSQWWKNRRSSGRCHYCDASVPPRELTMDHIVPLVRGGFTEKGNIAPCCKDCNSAKRDLLPIEWEAWLRQQRGPRT